MRLTCRPIYILTLCNLGQCNYYILYLYPHIQVRIMHTFTCIQRMIQFPGCFHINKKNDIHALPTHIKNITVHLQTLPESLTNCTYVLDTIFSITCLALFCFRQEILSQWFTYFCFNSQGIFLHQLVHELLTVWIKEVEPCQSFRQDGQSNRWTYATKFPREHLSCLTYYIKEKTK